MLKNTLHQLLSAAVRKAYPEARAHIELEVPAQVNHGDYATNVAMTLTKNLKKNPREIAQNIISHLDDPERIIAKAEVAGPGFINFTLKPACWISALHAISDQGGEYGRSKEKKGRKVLIEFVSANPTGPLHVGHGRNAVLGDTLARLLKAAGYTVEKEYYVNDGGVQIHTLGKSVYYRVRQELGEDLAFPEDAYQGGYVVDLAKKVLPRWGEFKDWEEAGLITHLGRWACDAILEEIKKDMALTGVTFDHYFFESHLYEDSQVTQTLQDLKEKSMLYEHEGALWLASTRFSDDKDRVLIKKDGSYTYLAPDIAYHRVKYERGYDEFINIWGADHAGYGPRLKAGLAALGKDADKLTILYVQMVNLIREGKSVSMSTRRATYETLENVRNEVGTDATRYFYMMRSYQAQLDFDLDLAKKQSADNPVYYIQYAHARICSIFAKAREEQGVTELSAYEPAFAETLNLPEEVQLARKLLDYPELILKASNERAPHRVSHYVLELARYFQFYYDQARGDDRYRVVTGNSELTRAKLFLLGCIRQVLGNALQILGVTAPEKM